MAYVDSLEHQHTFRSMASVSYPTLFLLDAHVALQIPPDMRQAKAV